MMTPPTQEELAAIKLAASRADQDGQHIYTHPRDSNNWLSNEAWHRVASPATFLVLLALIEAQQKQIAEQASDVSYELMQDDIIVAGAEGPGALAEIKHYAMAYGQDGPCEVIRVTRQKVLP